MTPRVRLDRALLAIAGVLVGAGVAVALVPGLIPVVPDPVRHLDRQHAVDSVASAVATLLALYVLWRLYSDRGSTDPVGEGVRGPADERSLGPVDDGPLGPADERSTVHDSTERRQRPRLVGSEFTRQYERRLAALRASGGTVDPDPPGALRDTIETLERARGHDAVTARARVERGAWTDDPIAAAFVGNHEAGTVPFWRRVYALVYPARAFERRFDRTLAALERATAERPGATGSGVARETSPGGTHEPPPATGTCDREV